MTEERAGTAGDMSGEQPQEDTGRTGHTGYAPRDDDVPLRGYAALAAVFGSGIGLFALGMRAAHRPPARLSPWDVLLVSTATYKASRLLSKDRITSFLRAPFTRRTDVISASEVMDEPRGEGVRRAVGELVGCPFCMATWVAGGLVCSHAAAPRATRLVTGGLTAIALADWLHYAWSLTQEKAEDDG